MTRTAAVYYLWDYNGRNDQGEQLNNEPSASRPAVYRARSAPFDDSPTVAILDRFREMRREPRATEEPAPRRPRDDGGFAERFLRSRRYAARHTSDT